MLTNLRSVRLKAYVRKLEKTATKHTKRHIVSVTGYILMNVVAENRCDKKFKPGVLPLTNSVAFDNDRF